MEHRYAVCLPSGSHQTLPVPVLQVWEPAWYQSVVPRSGTGVQWYRSAHSSVTAPGSTAALRFARHGRSVRKRNIRYSPLPPSVCLQGRSRGLGSWGPWPEARRDWDHERRPPRVLEKRRLRFRTRLKKRPAGVIKHTNYNVTTLPSYNG